jgi:hypothetical protein
MPSSGTLSRVPLLRIDVSEKRIAYIIRMTIIGELGTLSIPSNRNTLRRILYPQILHILGKILKISGRGIFWNSGPEFVRIGGRSRHSNGLHYFNPDDVDDTFLRNVVLTRATWRTIPEDSILHSHRRENLTCYKTYEIFSTGLNK